MSGYIDDFNLDVTPEEIQQFYSGSGLDPDFNYDLADADLGDDELEHQLTLYNQGNMDEILEWDTNTGRRGIGGGGGFVLGTTTTQLDDLELESKLEQIKKTKERLDQELTPTIHHPFLGDLPVNKSHKQIVLAQASKGNHKNTFSFDDVPNKTMDLGSGLGNGADLISRQAGSQPQLTQNFGGGMGSVGEKIVGQGDLNITSETQTHDLHKLMESWMNLDDQIRDVAKVQKALIVKKSKISLLLSKDMKDLNVGFLSEGNQQIKYKVHKSKKPYNQTFIQEKSAEFFADPDLAKKFADFLEESRPMQERVSLERAAFKE